MSQSGTPLEHLTAPWTPAELPHQSARDDGAAAFMASQETKRRRIDYENLGESYPMYASPASLSDRRWRARSKVSDSSAHDPSSPGVDLLEVREPRSSNRLPSQRRTPRNAVGRRYRDNVNRQIDRLRSIIPEVNDPASPYVMDAELDSSFGRWPSKPLILAAAVEYIGTLRQEKLEAESRAKALEIQLMDTMGSVQCHQCHVLQYIHSKAWQDQLSGTSEGGWSSQDYMTYHMATSAGDLQDYSGCKD